MTTTVDLLTIAEAAARLRMSEQSLRTRCYRRQIGHVRDGRLVTGLRPEHVTAYLDAHTVLPADDEQTRIDQCREKRTAYLARRGLLRSVGAA